MNIPRSIRLPDDLSGDKRWFESLVQQTQLVFEVAPTYLVSPWADTALPEVLAIQRLVTLANQAEAIRVIWPRQVFERVAAAPNIFPLLAVALSLDNTAHCFMHEEVSPTPASIKACRTRMHKYQLATDIFADSQIALSVDSRAQGRALSLYASKSGELLPLPAFEQFAERLLTAQLAVTPLSLHSPMFSRDIAKLIIELLDNTDRYATRSLNEAPLNGNGIRGLMLKRLKLAQAQQDAAASGSSAAGQELDALEISVFDAGIGLYSAFTQKALTHATSLDEEWRSVHRCLERHYDAGLSEDEAVEQGQGLYEVLRATKALQGILEIRSGRLYGFRTFVNGERAFQLQARESGSRSGLPKPVLLDLVKRLGKVPTAHEQLLGTSVRVVIPLRQAAPGPN